MTGEQNRGFEETIWKTHCRELQISAIRKEVLAAHRRIFCEHEPAIISLKELGGTPPVLMSKEERAEIIPRAIEGVKVIHAIYIINHIFDLLEKAIAPDSPSISDIPLKGEPGVLRSLEEMFRREQQVLHTALAESEKIAVGIILENFQKEGIPLFEYLKRVLSLRIELQSTVDGGSFAYLPTTIDGIFVRYYYSQGQESPVMSLEVKRLE